jgi:anhydro-N-acetylmuramic acid kinase
MDVSKAIGCISGTSMDGIDVAVLATDGDLRVEGGPGKTYPYDPALRQALRDFITDPARAETDPLTDLEAAVTRAHTAAVQRFMADFPEATAGTTVVGLHGQTVWHNPAARFTRQLMDGATAATLLGLPTVTRFRHADVAAGGQGAPLVPLFHRAIVAPLPQPIMVLNWGGVGNVTYVDGNTVLAFDTGPASALLDDWTQTHTGAAFDDDGRLAAAGRCDEARLARWMSDAYFDQKPPKSLDRQHFRTLTRDIAGASPTDGAATLAAFTIEATATARRHLPAEPRRWLVAGGGRLNTHLMAGLAARVSAPVEPIETIGWNGDALEAHCFAYLAVRSQRGIPLSLPMTTGVPAPQTGGSLNQPLQGRHTI